MMSYAVSVNSVMKSSHRNTKTADVRPLYGWGPPNSDPIVLDMRRNMRMANQSICVHSNAVLFVRASVRACVVVVVVL